jgi:hypothetical protein
LSCWARVCVDHVFQLVIQNKHCISFDKQTVACTTDEAVKFTLASTQWIISEFVAATYSRTKQVVYA